MTCNNILFDILHFLKKQTLRKVGVIPEIMNASRIMQSSVSSIPIRYCESFLLEHCLFDLVEFGKGTFNCENVDNATCRNPFVQIQKNYESKRGINQGPQRTTYSPQIFLSDIRSFIWSLSASFLSITLPHLPMNRHSWA